MGLTRKAVHLVVIAPIILFHISCIDADYHNRIHVKVFHSDIAGTWKLKCAGQKTIFTNTIILDANRHYQQITVFKQGEKYVSEIHPYELRWSNYPQEGKINNVSLEKFRNDWPNFQTTYDRHGLHVEELDWFNSLFEDPPKHNHLGKGRNYYLRSPAIGPCEWQRYSTNKLFQNPQPLSDQRY